MSKLTKTEVFAKDIFCAAFVKWEPSKGTATVNTVSELVKWSAHTAVEFVKYLDKLQRLHDEQ